MREREIQKKMEKEQKLRVQQERRDTCTFACGKDIMDYEEIERFTNTTDY